MAEFYHTALHLFNSLSYAIRDLLCELFVFPSITISILSCEGRVREVMPKSLYMFSSNECMFLLLFHMIVEELYIMQFFPLSSA